MVQLNVTFVLALLLAIPAFAAPLTDGDFYDIDARDLNDLNDLEARRFHIHISAKKIFKDVTKYGPKALKLAAKFAGNTKYGKYLKYAPDAVKALNAAKTIASREDLDDDLDSFFARDMDAEELEELLARESGHRVSHLVKKFEKAHRHAMKKAERRHHRKQRKAFAAGLAIGASASTVEQPSQDGVAAPVEPSTPADMNARELEEYLEVLARSLGEWPEDIEERELYGDDDESLFQRDYEEFGLDELD